MADDRLSDAAEVALSFLYREFACELSNHAIQSEAVTYESRRAAITAMLRKAYRKGFLDATAEPRDFDVDVQRVIDANEKARREAELWSGVEFGGRHFRAKGPRLTFYPFTPLDFIETHWHNGMPTDIVSLAQRKDELVIDTTCGVFVLQGAYGTEPWETWKLIIEREHRS